MLARTAISRARSAAREAGVLPFGAAGRVASPQTALLARGLRTTQPAEIGPFVAGIGLAVAVYGAKLLLQASSNPRFKESMRSRDGSAPDRPETEAEVEARFARRAAREAHEKAASGGKDYMHAGVMGVDLGEGAKEWGGACVAIIDGGDAAVAVNENGARTTPAVVAFSDAGEVSVGAPAKKQIFSRTATAISAHTLLLGSAFESTESRHVRGGGGVPLGAAPIDVAEGDGGAAAIRVHGVLHAPDALASRVISALKGSAEAALGGRTVFAASIAVPAGASASLEAAAESAGRSAGLPHVRLISAPIAAALGAQAAGALPEAARDVGVLVMGGLSTSAAVVRHAADGEWEVIGASRVVDGDGSDGLDDALVDYLAETFVAEHGIELRSDHLALQRLHEAAEGAKSELASAVSASVSLPFITADASGPKHMELSLSRARFGALVGERIRGPIAAAADGALAAAGMRPADLDAVLLAGGGARAQVVAEIAAEVFGRQPLSTTRPEELVALGAARHAAAAHEANAREARGARAQAAAA